VSTATATTRIKLTPPQVARAWGVDVAKVLTWIHSGELRAINAAEKLGGRPRYLISRADLEIFEQRRAVQPQTTTPRRRRRQPAGVIQFFK
jgi:hypothetical protein